MGYLGYLCLGGFIGGFLSAGLAHTGTENGFVRVVSTVGAAIFTGSLQVFLEKLQGIGPKDAVFCYPVGLVLAMMWYYAPAAAANVRGPGLTDMLLGIGHLAGLVIVTCLALLLALPTAWRAARS